MIVDPHLPDEAVLRRAVGVLQAGGLVAIPTETVYGLAASALDPRAVRRIYEAKGRPSNNPLIVHVASLEQARSLAVEWPDWAARLAERFWPGPLTIVVPRGPAVSDAITGGGATVALRMPAHPVARRLIELGQSPLAAPSANRSTRISPTTADHVLGMLDGRIELVIDAGATSGGIESTVVGCVDGQVNILRPGPLMAAQLEAALDQPVVVRDVRAGANDAAPLASPGTLARHYAPLVPLECLPASETAARVKGLLAAGERVGWLRWASHAAQSEASSSGALVAIEMPEQPAGYAARLYAALHELEGADVTRIVVDTPPEDHAWLAIQDRLRRAACRI
ncbi:MAG: threonylcarbamoyl-AMP synthase [Planctomycetes bacterium]|nr:threonylcarbamoyl-AMP synthase [Planctomycetota bacterium]